MPGAAQGSAVLTQIFKEADALPIKVGAQRKRFESLLYPPWLPIRRKQGIDNYYVRQSVPLAGWLAGWPSC